MLGLAIAARHAKAQDASTATPICAEVALEQRARLDEAWARARARIADLAKRERGPRADSMRAIDQLEAASLSSSEQERAVWTEYRARVADAKTVPTLERCLSIFDCLENETELWALIHRDFDFYPRHMPDWNEWEVGGIVSLVHVDHATGAVARLDVADSTPAGQERWLDCIEHASGCRRPRWFGRSRRWGWPLGDVDSGSADGYPKRKAWTLADIDGDGSAEVMLGFAYADEDGAVQYGAHPPPPHLFTLAHDRIVEFELARGLDVGSLLPVSQPHVYDGGFVVSGWLAHVTADGRVSWIDELAQEFTSYRCSKAPDRVATLEDAQCARLWDMPIRDILERIAVTDSPDAEETRKKLVQRIRNDLPRWPR
jgi:hypothetical protein